MTDRLPQNYVASYTCHVKLHRSFYAEQTLEQTDLAAYDATA